MVTAPAIVIRAINIAVAAQLIVAVSIVVAAPWSEVVLLSGAERQSGAAAHMLPIVAVRAVADLGHADIGHDGKMKDQRALGAGVCSLETKQGLHQAVWSPSASANTGDIATAPPRGGAVQPSEERPFAGGTGGTGGLGSSHIGCCKLEPRA